MENSKILIETMKHSDLKKIKENLESDFDDFWDITTIQEELNCSNSIYIVSKYQEEILGFAGIKVILDEAELMNIVTRKNSRNLGIASLMLEYIIDLCKKRKIKRINLEVNTKNSIAINLYKKYNFKEVGLRKKYYNNTEDAILFSRDII